MDIFAVIGMFLGIGLILLGQAMEGGNIGQLLQITAAFIVLGGTSGAVVLSFPPKTIASAIKMLKDVFFPPKTDFNALITEIGGFATKARKEGIIALEKEANAASDPLLTLGLGSVADGTDPTLVREMMENQIGPIYEGGQRERDAAYHQGTAWPFMLGFYLETCMKIYRRSGLSFVDRCLIGLEEEMFYHGIGTLPELFDGNPPFHGRGALSFAMNVAAILRVNKLLSKFYNY